MYPELFKIPFTDLTVKSYGLMLVIGFLTAIAIIRRLSKNFTSDPQHITNAALYALITGVIGARVFYVVHYFDAKFKGDLLSIFAVWQGGLELLGGVLSAITVIILYMYYHKLPIRRYLDVLAIGLFAALAFGRIGCFLNGCCFGKPTNLPWAVKFPYASPAYLNQIYPDLQRNRPNPQLELPIDFFGYSDAAGNWRIGLKPYDMLTEKQKFEVENGPYQCMAVHPTQLYSSAMAIVMGMTLYLFWRRSQRAGESENTKKWFTKPGCTFTLMFIVYSTVRFFMEFVRDDNPFGFDGLTVSQNISIIMLVAGIGFMILFEKLKPDNFKLKGKKQ